jgi:O-antigen/teichoic acid export membrane protein
VEDQPAVPASAAAFPRRAVAGVTLARGGLLGAWFLASLLIARVLGPAALGLYALCQTAIQLLTDCAADPLDAAVMREAPLHLRAGERPAALEVIRAAFWLRGGAGLASLAVTAAVPWIISRLIFNSSHFAALALLTAAGVLGDLLLRSALGYLQVSERFGPFLAVDAVWQLARTGAAVGLVLTHRLTATTAAGLYVASPYLAFVAALLLLPSDVRTPAAPSRRRVAEVLHYSKWMGLALVMGAVSARLDIFLLNYFHGSAAVGLYAAALALAMIPDRLNGIVQTAIAPRIAPAHAAGQFWRLQRQYLRAAAPAAAAGGALALLAGRWIIPLLLSRRFAGSIIPFDLLVLGTLWNAAVMPLPAALLNFLAPRQTAAVTGAGLLLVLGGGLAVIPTFGAAGAAGVMLASRVAIDIASLLLVRRLTTAATAAPADAG